MLEPQVRHKMELVETYSSGAEEWHCPTCGRRLLMQWPPAYKKIVMEPGDEYAIHNASKGGPEFGNVQAAQPESELEPEPELAAEDSVHVDEARLEPWVRWLETVDFESWWERDAG